MCVASFAIAGHRTIGVITKVSAERASSAVRQIQAARLGVGPVRLGLVGYCSAVHAVIDL